MTPEQSIKVLLVEDSPFGAAIITKYLETSRLIHFLVTHVESMAATRDALTRDSFDAILLDLSLPDSDGLDTVATVRGDAPATPIVVMTASDDEEMVQQALKSGVQDYLLKDRDKGPQVARAIRYAIERQQITRKIEESESRFRDFAEVAADWFWETDADNRFTYFSDRLSVVLGVPVADLIGKTRLDLIARDTPSPLIERHLEDLAARRAFANFVYQTHIGGMAHYLRVSGKPRYTPEGEFIGYRGVASDVTEQIEAERFGEHMLTIMLDAMDAFPSGIAIFDANDVFLVGNIRLNGFFPNSGDLFIPGAAFTDLLRDIIEREGLAAGTPDDIEAWVATWQETSRNSATPQSLDLNSGARLEVQTFVTERRGLLRLFVDGPAPAL